MEELIDARQRLIYIENCMKDPAVVLMLFEIKSIAQFYSEVLAFSKNNNSIHVDLIDVLGAISEHWLGP